MIRLSTARTFSGLAAIAAFAACSSSDPAKPDGSPSDQRMTDHASRDRATATGDLAATDGKAWDHSGAEEGPPKTDHPAQEAAADLAADRGAIDQGQGPATETGADSGTDSALLSWDPSLGSWAYYGAAEEGKGLSEVAVDFCRLALSKDGRPLAAYAQADANATPKVLVKRWGPSSIEALGGNTAVGKAVRRQFALVEDSSGSVWISTTTDADNVIVYRHDGAVWQAPTALTSDGSSSATDLILDSTGHPVVAFRYQPTAPAIGVRYFDGSNWQGYTPEAHLTGTNNNLALGLLDDRPIVLFADTPAMGHVVANYDNKVWETVGAPDPIHDRDAVDSMAMDIDSLGRPWLLFRSHGSILVLYLDGGQWKGLNNLELQTKVDSSSVFDTMDIKLVKDVPVITFVSAYGTKGIRVWGWHGIKKSWVPLGDTALVGATSSHYPQFARGSDGKLYLGYRDAAEANKMSIKVYTPAL